MKRTITITFGLIAAMAIAPFLMTEQGSVKAQENCKSFEAIAQATLPTTRRLYATDKWGGPLYARLGDQLINDGLLTGDDGTKIVQKNIAHGIDGVYFVGFGCTALTSPAGYWTCTDTFKVEIPVSVFDSPPPLFGRYNGNTARVNGGTGIFANAYGNLNYSGTYIVWTLAPGDKGRFNAELSGNICGIE